MAGVEGRVALVTGAGRGIGRETALLLAERGARVMATARTEGRDMVEAFQLGANDYVTKPLDYDVVVAAMGSAVYRFYGRKLIDQKPRWRAVAPEARGLTLSRLTGLRGHLTASMGPSARPWMN